ncbi:MAG: YeeE/YedE family protein [Gammaproteobacteria bacterium]|nr:YeeE/YedE family protein [Gammaproteobacteria bacterium]
MRMFTALLSGLLFGLGLIISGMANPAKVIGFLDVAGHWDPSLAFVMSGAILVALPAFVMARRRARSLLGATMDLPPPGRYEHRAALGSALFGAGWGIAGFCPGPAFVSLGSGQARAVLFVIAMIGGMAFYEAFQRLRVRRTDMASTPA